MAKFSRDKGQRAEREIVKMMNEQVNEVRQGLGLPPLDTKDLPFQRNQNQSAVGGSDLTNPFGISFEVKDHAQLSVNTWWKQCVEAAERTNEIPVLIYKNGTGPNRWCFVMKGAVLPLPTPKGETHLQSTYHFVGSGRVTMHHEVFKEYMLHVLDNFYSRVAENVQRDTKEQITRSSQPQNVI